MKNLLEYNAYIQSLESQAKGGLFFHHVNQQIYITDFSNRLLGVWDLDLGQPIQWKETQ